MASPFLTSFVPSSFHYLEDLVGLRDMIKAFSLKLSVQARERLAWMDTYRECDNAKLVCRKFGISYGTFWRWKRRYDPWNLKSLESLSRRPQRFPRKTSWDIAKRVLEVKKSNPRWGKEKISLYLKTQGVNLSGKTCWKILRRHALIVRYHTRKRRAPKPRLNWAEIRLPGDLLEVDTKYVSLQGQRLFQYTAIDVVSRWRYVEIYRALDSATAAKFLANIVGRAPFIIRTVQTDNGKEFGRMVTFFLRRQKINHVFTHKHRPIENSHVERSHRIDEEEFWSLDGYGTTLEELRNKFAQYLQMYNSQRPHWGLGGRTPLQTLNSFLAPVCQMS